MPLIWPAVKDWIAQSLSHGSGYWPEDMRKALLCREMTLWLVKDAQDSLHACVITRFFVQPHANICELFLVGGKGLEHWAHLLSTIEAFAKTHGAHELRAHGRLGWKKAAKIFGFDLMQAIYRKEL